MKLLLCGDTVPTDASRDLFAKGDIQGLFGTVLGAFSQADHVIVNLECALTEGGRPIRKFGPNLKGPVQTAQTLKRAGVTACALANNHILDFGVQGLHDTMAALSGAGLHWFGAGENDIDAAKPYIITGTDEKVAILAVSEHEYCYALPDQPGGAPFDPFDTMADIAQAKSQANVVIVIYHGGKEHCEVPSPRLRKACRAMVRAGADLILCQHSHIIGCQEAYQHGRIVYGQGNFHFVKYHDTPGWTRGLMVSVETGKTLNVQFLPTVAGEAGITLAKGEEKDAFLTQFAAFSEHLKDERWLADWSAFCQKVAPYYIQSVQNAYADSTNERLLEHFAHYLDCEAHTDVYQELFPTWHKSKTDGA